MDKKVQRIKELTELLQKASYAYYGQDNSIMSDKNYDDLYDELLKLEAESGCVLAGSPTQKVQGYILNGFSKVEHSKPMLSANKTKDVHEIEQFVKEKEFYGSYKLDGLTVVVRYKDGKFMQGITRGTGIVGEDITEQCKFIRNLPMFIQYKNDLELRGECVIAWDEFKIINETLESPYSHPRNLAAGTLRNLDLNVVKERKLSFVLFECVTDIGEDSKSKSLTYLSDIGFEIVPITKLNCTVEQVNNALQPEFYAYPTDGIVFEIDSRKLSETLGSTAHHECCRMALKWEDELYETKLKDIEWNTSKTGLINPVAVFEPVDLDGAITTRATLHNISYIEELRLGIGDTIRVYRANMVIPKVHDNLTKSNTWKLADKCPCCGGNVEIHNDNGSKTLHCINPDCKAKLLGKLSHFVGKNAINIDGLSEQTLQKFIDRGWLNSFQDIYYLSEYKEEMYKLNGFGKKSVDKLLENIEKSRNTTLDRFIYALCIPLIGRTASKNIAKEFNNQVEEFYDIWCHSYDFTKLNDFGKSMNDSMQSFIENNYRWIVELIGEFNFRVSSENGNAKNILDGKTFVITGSLKFYKNREELISIIERNGGKAAGSVSAKTSYLVNNNISSISGKNKKAHDLGIPIISEDDFIKMITKSNF